MNLLKVKVVGLKGIFGKPAGLFCLRNQMSELFVVSAGITEQQKSEWREDESLIVGKYIHITHTSTYGELHNDIVKFPRFVEIAPEDREEEEEKMKFIAEVVDISNSLPYKKAYKLVEILASDKETARRRCVSEFGYPKRLFEAEEVESRSDKDIALENVHDKVKDVLEALRPIMSDIREVRMRERMEDEYIYNVRDAHRDIMNAMERIRRAGRCLRKKESGR